MENEVKTWICSHCSKEFSEEIEKISTIDGHVCQECLDNDFGFCEVTEEYYQNDELTTGYKMGRNGQKVEMQVYENCEGFVMTYDDEFWLKRDVVSAYVNSLRATDYISQYDLDQGGFFTCEDCGDIFSDDYCNSIDSGNFHVCNNCYDHSYAYCEGCNTAHHVEDECFNQENEEKTTLIKNYSFKPVPKFKGINGNLSPFIGFELEIESKKGSRKEQAENISENLGDIIYLKEDGSLSNGFEIVSHPMTLLEHKKVDYKAAFNQLANLGAKSHDTTTCGLHFHLDKSKMTDTHKVRFGTFFALEKSKLEILARRTASSYAKFKAKNLNDLESYARNSDRYEAVNWQNEHTVEVRIFKGTLKYETFMASMELCQAIYNFTQLKQAFCTLNDNQLWTRFIKFINKNASDYAFLISYIDSKKDLLDKAFKLDDLETKKAKIEKEILEVNSSMTLNDLQTA